MENSPKIFKIAVIGDIHFGIKDSSRLFSELHQFTDYISKNEIDMVVFNGDYFDAKLSVGDLATIHAMSFFQAVFNICKEKHIPLRMLQGTRSHDLNQLMLFEAFTRDLDANFRIFETFESENIAGIDILYLPEEYPEDSKAYYADVKSKKYNILFGHGTWDFMSFGAEKKTITGVRHSPVFEYDEWLPTFENGLAVFGHIHGRTSHKDKVYYPGSFSRWSFGERGDRGFAVVSISLADNSWSIEHINNTEAPEFNVFSMKEISENIESLSAADAVALIQANLTENNHFRIDVSGMSADQIELIKKSFEDNPLVKLEIKENRSMLRESSDSERFKKYEYITKRQLPLDKTIQRFCEEELKVKLSLEVIENILKK